jgi:hypothetical protein
MTAATTTKRKRRPPPWLTLKEAAAWAGVSSESVRRACKAGRVESSFSGGEWWVTEASVKATWPMTTSSSAPVRLRLVSGGPTTDEGKARSSRNSLQHGLFAREAVIREGKLVEDGSEFQKLLLSVTEALAPATSYERAKVEQIAILEWRRRRLIQAERSEFQNSEWCFLYGRRASFDAHEAHLGAAMRRLIDEIVAVRAAASTISAR